MANGKTYSEKLKDPRWQKKRLEIMERDNFTCVHCEDKETTLNVHHKKYNGEPWKSKNEDLETVCEDCHSVIEDIESVINGKINLFKIIKIKNRVGFSLLYILNDGVFITPNGNTQECTWIETKCLESIIKTIKDE